MKGRQVKHVKRIFMGLALLASMAFVFFMVSLVAGAIGPEYILLALSGVWLGFICYITGMAYETYKEIKNIKPY